MGYKKLERHERMYGPHFNEECALKVVSKMQNEDGTKGQHWSLSEAIALANRYGVSLNTEHYNKYDWYVALNMIYSDYYSVTRNISVSDQTKFFIELAKAWIKDKDVDEGKMWYYYKYVICDEYHDDYYEEDEDEYIKPKSTHRRNYRNDDYYEDYMYDRDEYRKPSRERVISRY